MKKILASTFIAVALTSCASITFTQQKTDTTLATTPDYEDSKHYFLNGFIGTSHINVAEVCGDKEVIQFQSIKTPVDILFTVVTAGLYAPKTAKVWCQK